jgi:hypothetical protein
MRQPTLGAISAARFQRVRVATRQWIARGMESRPHWGTFSFGAFYLTCGALLAITGFSNSNKRNLRVFGSFWESGSAALHHLNPYGIYPLTYRFTDFLHQKVQVSLNLSPPTLLPFFEGIAHFDPQSTVKVWTFASLLLFLASIWMLMIEYGRGLQRRQILWFLLGPTAVDTLLAGQDYALLVTAVVLAWLLLEHHHQIAAGVFLGVLVAIKPNYPLCVVFLALSGYMRMAKTTLLTLFALAWIPLLIYGPGVYLQWLHAIGNDPHWIFPTDVSITAFCARLDCERVGQVISAIVLLGTVIFVVKKRPSAENALGISLCLGMLTSPLAWIHYLMFLAPVLFRRPWDTSLSLVMLLLMVPTQLSVIARHTSETAVFVTSLGYFFPVCYLFVHFLCEAAAESRAAREGQALEAAAAS